MNKLGDISRHLLLRMKNRDIVALSIASPAIAEQMSKLRHDSDFFHGLTEREFDKELDRRTGADWYTIYHNLTVVDNDKRYAAVSSDLDSLSVQAEVYSDYKNRYSMTPYYESVRTAHVFKWALATLSGQIDQTDPSMIITAIKTALHRTLRKNTEEGEQMLAMILLPPYDQIYKFTRSDALRDVVEVGNLEAAIRISKDNPLLLIRDYSLLSYAVISNNPDMVSYIAAGKGRIAMTDESAIRWAIQDRKDKSLQVLLSVASNEVMGQVMMWFLERVQERGLDREEFTWMLENGVQISLDTWERLMRILYVRAPREKNLDLLELKHKYAAITRLDIDSQLYYSGDNLSTYWKLGQFLLSLVADAQVHLLTMDRTAEEILAYLRDELFTDEVKIAVQSIFNPTIKMVGSSPEYRALILYLIYPSMTMEESTKYLREVDKYSDNQILMSNLLIKLVPR